MRDPSSDGVITRIQRQIADARQKIARISIPQSGNRFENTLDAVYADDIRAYWERKIYDLELLLGSYSSVSTSSAGAVKEGDRIRLIKVGTAKILDLTVSNRVELFRENKCISTSSPIGRAVLSRRVGEIVSVITPQGRFRYQILAKVRT